MSIHFSLEPVKGRLDKQIVLGTEIGHDFRLFKVFKSGYNGYAIINRVIYVYVCCTISNL